MNNRLKEVRETLSKQRGKKISRQNIADELGVSVSNIESYELSRRTPSLAFIKLFCDKYNVNEGWLRTGEGNMFEPNREKEMSILSKRVLKADEDDYIAKLIKNLAVLDIEDWKELNRIIKKLLKDQEKDSSVN